MNTGYMCGVCGYEPDFNELNRGGCPVCHETSRILGPIELKQINSLPVDGTVDIYKRDIIEPTCIPHLQDSRSPYPDRKTWWTDKILARFRCVTINNGERLFSPVSEIVEHKARDCYEECDPGTGTVRIIKRRTGKPNNCMIPWTASDVHSWGKCERTYGAWIVIKDNVPTNGELARERMIDAFAGASFACP